MSLQTPNPYATVRPPYASSSRSSYSGPSTSSSTSVGGRIARLVKRLFKFPSMDFEVAVWEMTTLMWAPRKVFRNAYYRKQTKNTYTTTDPAFPYLLAFFLLLTSLAWSLAYATPSFPNIVRIALFFVVIHCLLSSLIVATLMYFFLARLGSWAGGSRAGSGSGRKRGLFEGEGAGEELEWGFCFDISIRSFLPLFAHLYILQFLLLPLLTTPRFLSTFLSNALHLLAFSHSTYITFLGYNSLPSLSSPQLLLVAPLMVFGAVWVVGTVGGWNASLKMAPVLWCAGGLRRSVG